MFATMKLNSTTVKQLQARLLFKTKPGVGTLGANDFYCSSNFIYFIFIYIYFTPVTLLHLSMLTIIPFFSSHENKYYFFFILHPAKEKKKLQATRGHKSEERFDILSLSWRTERCSGR